MKKSFYQAAAFLCLAMAFASCNDIYRCFEITVSVPLNEEQNISYTEYVHATKNNVWADEERLKEEFLSLGIKEELITINSNPAPKSSCK